TAGPQPLVFVWRRGPKARSWSLMQTLGPDSLGGVGTARFLPASADSGALESRTWRRTPGFEECPSCSHVYTIRRFRWRADGLSTIESEIEDAPYVSFVRLVQALSVPDLELARDYVADDATFEAVRALGLEAQRTTWRQAPGGDEVPNEMTFYRGTKE